MTRRIVVALIGAFLAYAMAQLIGWPDGPIGGLVGAWLFFRSPKAARK